MIVYLASLNGSLKIGLDFLDTGDWYLLQLIALAHSIALGSLVRDFWIKFEHYFILVVIDGFTIFGVSSWVVRHVEGWVFYLHFHSIYLKRVERGNNSRTSHST